MQFNIPAEHKRASGIYIIRNSVNSKVYVGSAVNFWKRFLAHCSDLRRNRHHSYRMQRHITKYGAESLSFCLLEVVASAAQSLTEVEQIHITAFDAANPKKGFNNVPQVFPVIRHSETTKGKISKSKTGVKMTEDQLVSRQTSVLYQNRSDEFREKLRQIGKSRPVPAGSRTALLDPANKAKAVAALRERGPWNKGASALVVSACLACGAEILAQPSRKKQFCNRSCWRGRPLPSEETREKLAAAHRGKPKSLEAIAKQVASRRAGAGYQHSAETRAKISATLQTNKAAPVFGRPKGTILSAETRAKMSATHKGIGSKPSAEARAKSVAKITGQPRSEETKRKISQSHTGQTRSPEQRAAISAALKGRAVSWTREQIAKRSATRRANTEARKALA